MNTLVVRPTDEPGTQGGRQPLESGAVAGTDAPGATQHQRYRRVRPEGLFQDVNPFEQSMPCGLVWAHVDALAGMPKHCLMVNYTIKIQIENHVRTARGGCRKIGRSLVKGHGGHAEILRLFDHIGRLSTAQSGLLLSYPCNRAGQTVSLTPERIGRSLINMSQSEPTILGLTAAQYTSIAKRAVTQAVQSDVQAGIAVTGFVDGKVQTLEPSDPRLSKFLQDEHKADGG